MLAREVLLPIRSASALLMTFWTVPELVNAVLGEFVVCPRSPVRKLQEFFLTIRQGAHIRFHIGEKVQPGK